MNRDDPKFPMKFPAGLGYSPAAAGPVGGYSYTPGPGFFGKQSMNSLLPRQELTPVYFFGRRKSFGSKRILGTRAFGYPLMNRPNQNLNERMFPRYPVGVGNTPGGDGGVWMQSGGVNFNTYWGFGKKSRKMSGKIPKKSRKLPRKSRKKSRKIPKKSRKSRKRSRKRSRRSNN